MEKAIQKAIEGGYERPIILDKIAFALTVVPAKNLKDRSRQKLWQSVILIDPLFWQALRDGANLKGGWLIHWHHFIDHLAEGKDADSFFEELLK